MKLAIVGSVCLAGNKEAEKIINEVLDRYNPDEVVSGGAIGIDSMAAAAWRARGHEPIEHLPKIQNWLHGSPNGFEARNLLIATECDVLVRIVAAKKPGIPQTYGSGWTRDRAKEMGKSTEEFIIEDWQ